ncbi:hypothetical protein DRQ25_18195, partial [Candidatus Fermentibacteria bacterium]
GVNLLAGEYKITIQNKESATSVFGGGKQAKEFDAGKVSAAVERALTKSMGSMETTIQRAILSSLKNNTGMVSDNADVVKSVNKISKEITTTLKNTVNSAASTDNKLDSKLIASAVSSALEASLKKHFKALNTAGPSGGNSKAEIASIVTGVLSQMKAATKETVGMSKVVRELSNLNKELSVLPTLIAALKSNSSGLDIQSLAGVLNKAVEAASRSKTSIATVKEVGKKSGMSQEVVAELSKLAGINKNLTAEVAKISSGADKDIKQLLTKVVALLNKSISTYDASTGKTGEKATKTFSKDNSNVQEFSKALKDFMSELTRMRKTDSSAQLETLIRDVAKSSKHVQNVKVTEVEVPSLTKITSTIDALSTVVNTLKSVSQIDVKLNVKGVEEAKKQVEDAATDQVANVDVQVDGKAARDAKKTVEDLSKDQQVYVGIDIDNASIKQMAHDVERLKKELAKSTTVKVDDKVIKALETRLKNLANNFDYVSSTIGKELTKNAASYTKQADTMAAGKDHLGQPLTPKGTDNLTKSMTSLEAKHTMLAKKLDALHSVMDRVAEARVDKKAKDSNLDPRGDILTKAGSGRLDNFKVQLDTTNLDKLLTGSATNVEPTKKMSGALADIAAIKDLAKILNDAISENNAVVVATNKAAAETRKLVEEQKRNTLALNQARKQAEKIEQDRKRKNQPGGARPSTTSEMKSQIATIGIRYAQEVIRPDATYTGRGTSGNEYEAKVYNNMERLARSLDALQKTIYDTTSQGLADRNTKNRFENWKVVERGAAKEGRHRAFSQQDRQWSMEIVDVKKLASLLGSNESIDPAKLLDNYVAKLSKNVVGTKSSMSEDIATWLKQNVKGGDLTGLKR